MRSTLTALCVATCVTLVVPTAFAQQADEPGEIVSPARQRTEIEQITITAQRREENLQSAPIAVSAFSAYDVERSDLDGLESVALQVPSLVFASTLSSVQITMRGVGVEITTIAGEPGVSLNVDGVYRPRLPTSSALYADLERIEVLRGPQGTLYGRNATGGTVNLWSKTPSGETEGNFSVLYGNSNRLRTRGGVSFPILGETLSARVSFSNDQHDGYRTNRTRGTDLDERDANSARGVLRWTPSEDLDVIFRADWSRHRDGGPVPTILDQVFTVGPLTQGGNTGDNPRKARLDAKVSNILRSKLFSNTVTWDLHDLPLLGEATLKSLTSYQRNEWVREADNDATDLVILFMDLKEQSKVWSQELTLSSAGDTRLEWVFGAYYYSDRGYHNSFFPSTFALTGFSALGFGFDQDTEAWAGFAQFTYNVTDRLRATVGARYTREEKDFKHTLFLDFPGPFRATLCEGLESDREWKKWTPKFGLDYNLTDNMMVYASMSRGFKAGGANPLNFGCAAGIVDTYDQEDLWAYELGLKSEWFDNRLQLNLVGFFYDYGDFQANKFSAAGAEIENASDAEVLGLEVEFIAIPIEGLEIDGYFSILDNEFEDFISDDPLCVPALRPDGCVVQRNLKGNNLPRAPEKSFHVGAQYTLPVDPGSVTFRYEFTWSDNYYFSAFNNPLAEQNEFSMSQARIIFATAGGRLEDRWGDLELHFFMNNWGDKDYLTLAAECALCSGVQKHYGDPRNFGVELRYRFD